MQSRSGWYDPAILEEFAKLHATESTQVEEKDLPLRQVEEGMVFADDVRTRNGLLLIARGHEATTSMLERIRNLSPNLGVKEPIRVIVKSRIPVGPAVVQS